MPKRRTQQERRETTIRALLDAATATLIERGYAEASVQRICERAELSQGALFRHFATREALMVAVGEDVGAQILARYRKRFASGAEADIRRALALVRTACRSRLNIAWYELSLAARTSPNLRRGLEPVARRYFENIVQIARELLPGLAERLGSTFDVLVTTVIATFDGEVTHRWLARDPALEDARVQLLATVIDAL